MRIAGALSAIAILFVAHQAGAAPLYSNDFSSNANGFTGGTLTVAPSTEQYYGQFGPGGAATLHLSGLAMGTKLQISFNLYTINSLDGDGHDVFGPDSFKLTFNGSNLFDHTFTNDSVDGLTQNYPTPGSAPGSGSIATGTLGYTQTGPDHTYLLTFANLTVSSLGAGVFKFLNNADQTDEDFGIDNVVVTAVAPTPVPAALPLFASALVGLGFIARRRKKTPAA